MRGAESRDRRRRARRAAALLSLGLTFCPPVAPASGVATPSPEQEPAGQFEAAVEVIRVHVVVRDAEESFVSGLEAEDFNVRLNGRERTVVDALEMEASRPVLAAMGPADDRAPDPDLPTGAHRQFLIYLDLMSPNPRGLRNARSAAIDFVEDGLAPGDRIGLAVHHPARGLQLLVPFTGEHARVREGLEGIPIHGFQAFFENQAGFTVEELEDAVGDGVARMLTSEIDSSRYSLGAEEMLLQLRELGRTLAAIQGRKHVLYFSTGIDDRVLESASFTRTLEEATVALRSSDTVVHTLQPEIMRGITSHDVRNQESTHRPGRRAQRVFVDREVLSHLASETGGESAWFRHNLRRGISRIEERSRRYYAVAFQIRSDDPPVGILEITVRRKGTTTIAPERLVLPRTLGNLTPFQRQLRVAEALELEVERDDFGLMLAGLPGPSGGDGQARLTVALQIPAAELNQIGRERGDGLADLEILGLAIDAAGRVRGFFRGQAGVADPEATGSLPDLRYVNTIGVPPGAYHVKLLIREAATDRISVRSLRFDAPGSAPAGLSVIGILPVRPASTAPMVWGGDVEIGAASAEASGLVPGADEDSPRAEPGPYPLAVDDIELAPALFEGVGPGASLDFLLLLDGLQPHPFTGRPEVTLRAEAIGRGSRVVALPEPETILSESGPGGRDRRVIRVRLPSSLPLGPNELRLAITDRISGSTTTTSYSLAILPR